MGDDQSASCTRICVVSIPPSRTYSARFSTRHHAGRTLADHPPRHGGGDIGRPRGGDGQAAGGRRERLSAMTEGTDPLPSWRPGGVRDALVAFLEAAEDISVADRVAYFDNDGTLWCERPSYVQLDFFLDALRRRVTADPSIRERAEFAALLSGDRAAVAGVGLERIALALAGLFDGLTPQEFTSAAREFMARATHATLDRPTRSVTYQPMLELIAELRRRDFTGGIVTGGGTEFVRAI